MKLIVQLLIQATVHAQKEESIPILVLVCLTAAPAPAVVQQSNIEATIEKRKKHGGYGDSK